MRILILGSGGREHALAWKISQSHLCEKLWIAPGNPGTAMYGENVAMGVNDFDAIKTFCLQHQVSMLVIGPEDPLVHGIYDFIKDEKALKDIHVIGPSKLGAQLEGSKAFAKKFMARHQIPTAAYREFNTLNFNEGTQYIQNHSLPIVLKADGLAAGKGVVICYTHEDALANFSAMIQESKFGTASQCVVVEEFLTGIESSVFVLTDGKEFVLLPSAKDYKRIGEGDTGLNTGGMGAISPVPFMDEAYSEKIKTKIILPTLKGIQEEQLIYKGFIFIGLIKVGNEPFVIEYNCRLGDPETEVILPRLENDLVDLFIRVSVGTLKEVDMKHSAQKAATVMLVSEGYPEDYTKGKEMILPPHSNSLLFHAGTAQANSKLLTSGGRVMAVTSLADSLSEALSLSYQTIGHIQYEGKNFRKDIGWEFI